MEHDVPSSQGCCQGSCQQLLCMVQSVLSFIILHRHCMHASDAALHMNLLADAACACLGTWQPLQRAMCPEHVPNSTPMDVAHMQECKNDADVAQALEAWQQYDGSGPPPSILAPKQQRSLASFWGAGGAPRAPGATALPQPAAVPSVRTVLHEVSLGHDLCHRGSILWAVWPPSTCAMASFWGTPKAAAQSAQPLQPAAVCSSLHPAACLDMLCPCCFMCAQRQGTASMLTMVTKPGVQRNRPLACAPSMHLISCHDL